MGFFPTSYANAPIDKAALWILIMTSNSNILRPWNFGSLNIFLSEWTKDLILPLPCPFPILVNKIMIKQILKFTNPKIFLLYMYLCIIASYIFLIVFFMNIFLLIVRTYICTYWHRVTTKLVGIRVLTENLKSYIDTFYTIF